MRRVLGLLLAVGMFMAGCSSDSPSTEVYTAVHDTKGGLWAGTKNGLYRQTAGDHVLRKMVLPSLTHHPFPAIYALCQDSVRERMWIGAWNHLYCYDLARERFITTDDSTIYETVGLLCDTLGYVKAYTQHGQYLITLADSLSGGERVERIDATRYPKPEMARIDVSGMTFEQDSHEGLAPGTVILVGGGATALFLLVGLLLVHRPSRPHKSATTEEPSAPLPHKEEQHEVDQGTLFLERAAKVVSAHLADEDFSVDQMASELAVSRAQLFRKLKAANGQTPKDFIDEQRMALACQLLRTTDRTISDIGWACGYSDASNFRRAFVRRFGITPSEYAKTAAGEQQHPHERD